MIWVGLMSYVNPLRLIAKALVLFVLANLLFGLFDPPVGKLSIFNYLIPGRVRFNADRGAVGQSESGALVFEDLDAMFASHVISNGPKPPTEYRIILLGDSAVWGFEVPPQETLSGQINRLDLRTCDGRQIRAYDLAYPLPSNTRDLVTLEKALNFQPDLVIWLVTLKTFDSTTAEKDLLIPQSEQVLKLIDRYHIKVNAEKFLHPKSFWDKTLVGSAVRLKKIVWEQLYGVLWAATGRDAELSDWTTASRPPEDVDSTSNYNDLSVSDKSTFDENLDFAPISAARDMVGSVPMLIVNEPIFRATGKNSNVRYNKYYPRWAYDSFRSLLMNWMFKKDVSYLDLWNSVPNEDFIVSPLHLNPTGEARLADLLIPEMTNSACR